MQEAQREALASLRLTWAPTADDLWRPQAETHVKGLNEYAADDVMEAFGDAARDPVSTPLGVVVRGPAGSGKTHLLGQIRERAQSSGGYFFVVELLDAASFWQSVRSGILESLGRPGAERETQLKDLLWELSSIAHVSRADRRAIIGDDDLEPETLDRFVNALAKARPTPSASATRRCARSCCWAPPICLRTTPATPTCSPARSSAATTVTAGGSAHRPPRRKSAFENYPG
jgi:hypothetical protein